MTVRVLVSYHYHRDTDLAALVAELGGDVDLFADSGAYSAATTGAAISLPDYAAWLRQWAPLLTVQAALDVIGDHEATARNVDRLRDAGCDPLPVFHVGEPWPVLEALCATNRYIALGGMALLAVGQAKQRPLMAWLVRCFRTAVPYGTVFHGFGMTSPALIRSLPFYSVDSSSYLMGRRFGLAYLWDDPAGKIRSVFFRNPAEVRPYADLLRRHGLDPARTIAPDYLRAGTPGFTRERAELGAASARAYQFMERHLTARHRVPAPPLPRADTEGTKVYLAASAREDFVPLTLLTPAGRP